MIRESTPFRGDKLIGRAYNDFCSIVPNGDWCLIRDPDTMYLQPDSQALIEQIVESDPPFDLIGCVTNRLRGDHQCVRSMFNVRDLYEHMKIAKKRREIWELEILPTAQPIAGMFMLFRKSLWDLIKFNETTGRLTDKQFSADILAAGGKLGVAQGLYLFHLYRFGSKDPYNDIKHLL